MLDYCFLDFNFAYPFAKSQTDEGENWVIICCQVPTLEDAWLAKKKSISLSLMKAGVSPAPISGPDRLKGGMDGDRERDS
jgi:hypothetical protein